MALLSENPNLEDQFAKMRSEIAVAREVLSMLEDIEHPHGAEIPQAPMRRLRGEIQEVFETAGDWREQIRRVLSKLEHRAGGRGDAEAEQVMAVVSAIRKILSKAEESAGPQVLGFHAAELRRTEGMTAKEYEAVRCLAEERMIQCMELRERVHRLESRIIEAERTIRDCHMELEMILDLLRRGRK
ncbi:MAG TPA: hypothetical protein PLW35_07375 [Verrucomicrobiota bacterium]|nr:hypothetical protein [Verrucomicrobiota bacterium]